MRHKFDTPQNSNIIPLLRLNYVIHKTFVRSAGKPATLIFDKKEKDFQRNHFKKEQKTTNTKEEKGA